MIYFLVLLIFWFAVLSIAVGAFAIAGTLASTIVQRAVGDNADALTRGLVQFSVTGVLAFGLLWYVFAPFRVWMTFGPAALVFGLAATVAASRCFRAS